MKANIVLVLALVVYSGANAQDFNKYLSAARSSYSANKLEDARFAIQQMLQEIDVLTGKEALKILPTKLDNLSFNTGNDNVSGNSGFAGIIIHRDYGTGPKIAEVEIIGNSPLMASVSAILSLPFGQNNGSQKAIKVDGYKALLKKDTDNDAAANSYEIQVPLNSSLLTLKAKGFSEDEVKKLAEALPVARLAALLQ